MEPSNKPDQDQGAQRQGVENTAPVNARRRGLLRASVAIPATLTVASAPVLGSDGQFVCGPASAAASIWHASGMARHAGRYQCAGYTPQQWSNMGAGTQMSGTTGDGGAASQTTIDAWPSPYRSNTRFSDVFTPLPSGIRRNHTLLEVLRMSNQQTAQVFISALLNVASGRVDPAVLGNRRVQDIWAAVNSSAGFVPYAGARPWTPAKTVAWLSTLWGSQLPPNFARDL